MKMLPFLVTVLAAAAIVGGVAHQANGSPDQSDRDAIVETGAKLCIASMAFVAAIRPIRPRWRGLVRLPVRAFLSSRPGVRVQFRLSPTLGAPRLHLLQILRT
jgi:hypothetical protein